MKETEEKEGGEDQFNEVGERRGAGELFLFSVLRCREGQRQKEEKRRDGSIQYTKDEYMKAHPITFTLSHPLLPPPSLPPSVCCGFKPNNIRRPTRCSGLLPRRIPRLDLCTRSFVRSGRWIYIEIEKLVRGVQEGADNTGDFKPADGVKHSLSPCSQWNMRELSSPLWGFVCRASLWD